MIALRPDGTVASRFPRAEATTAPAADWRILAEGDGSDPSYLGWEIARCADGLDPTERRALGTLAAACLMVVRSGSTRLPLDDARLKPVLAALGEHPSAPELSRMIARVRRGESADPVTRLVGKVGERKPLIVDGGWLYPEKLCALEEAFCARILDRAGRSAHTRETRSAGRALAAVSASGFALTDEQRRAVRAALTEPLALVTGGPGTGKTTIVVAVLRALAWLGERMDALAIAAPTGKAAQRMREAIEVGLAASARDIADAGLRAIAPTPQTLHRLLGWSPASGRFARHENDPLPYRVVIVDEASMVDLALMDRLLRALTVDARLVLLGDADQLPSVDAGAVFRDLCAGLKTVRLSTNLRVRAQGDARRIVAAAESVNGGALDARFTESVATRHSVDEITFEGVEHLALSWTDVADALIDRWWRSRVAVLERFRDRVVRTYRARGGALEEDDALGLRVLLEHHARSRLVCATRAAARGLNERLCVKLRDALGAHGQLTRGWAPGTPVIVGRNDYERQLFNGDSGIVVRVDSRDEREPTLSAVFPRDGALQVFPVDTLYDVSPCFALTVHKAQGSEFDDVALVLPEVDLPIVTRELVYTAMTRARRSVLLVGDRELLARAVSRTLQRYSGVAEKLERTG